MNAKKNRPNSPNESMTAEEFFKDLKPITPDRCLIRGSILYDYYRSMYCKIVELVPVHDQDVMDEIDDDHLYGIVYQTQKPLMYNDDLPFPKTSPIPFGKKVEYVAPAFLAKLQIVGHEKYSYNEFCNRILP